MDGQSLLSLLKLICPRLLSLCCVETQQERKEQSMSLQLFKLTMVQQDRARNGVRDERPIIQESPLSDGERDIWTDWLSDSWRGPEEFHAWTGYCTPNAILKRLEYLRSADAFSQYHFRTHYHPDADQKEVGIFGARDGHWWLLARWRIDEGPLRDFAEVKNDVRAARVRESATVGFFTIPCAILALVIAGLSVWSFRQPSTDWGQAIGATVLSLVSMGLSVGAYRDSKMLSGQKL
jgi:hypothetical protein